jgi:hypothetical protein
MAKEDVVGEGVKIGARKVPVVSLAMFFLAVLPNYGITKYSGGSGTPDAPYLIYTAAEMNQIGLNFADWDKHFKLMADINLSAYTGTQFNRIGTDDRHAFSGVFNGNGHKISNFTYTAPTGSYIGIFGHISSTAKIEKVALVNTNVTGSEFVGGLVGYNEGVISNSSVAGTVSGNYDIGGLAGYSDGSINNCLSTATVTGGGNSSSIGGLTGVNGGSISNCISAGSVSSGISSSYIGGLVGQSYYGIVSNSCSTAIVTGGSSSYCLGGLAGYNANGSTITSCWAGGNVSGGTSVNSVGGLVGENTQSGVITDCYATAGVAADYDVGGLVGMNDHGTITNCYASGSVSANQFFGGLLGWNYFGTTSNSFWDTNSSGQSWSAGGTGKTTAEMKTKSTFTGAGWDFVGETANGTNDIWAICEGVSYPRFVWQFIAGDSDNDGDVDFADFARMGLKWRQTETITYCSGRADFTGDGLVNLNDLAALADNWLQ